MQDYISVAFTVFPLVSKHLIEACLKVYLFHIDKGLHQFNFRFNSAMLT